MKKIFLVILIFLFIPFVNAETISRDDVSLSTYIIGKYMFTRAIEGNYDGKLTTQRIMLASKSINSNSESDMIIYYKNADGYWIDALTGNSIDVPLEFDIEVRNMNTTLNNTISSSGAINYQTSSISSSTYIIGKYMFTRNTSVIYDGKLTTRRMMLASRSIEGNRESDMIVYYKRLDGIWVNGLTNQSIEVPSYFEIINIDLEEQEEDLTPPTCTFSVNDVVDSGTNQIMRLTCLDYESGIAPIDLTSNAFSFDNTRLIISSISRRNITNGVEYQITFLVTENGEFTISLNDGKIKDNAGNNSNTPTKTFYGGRSLKATFNANNGSQNSVLQSCYIVTESSCEITLPDNSFTFSGWTFTDWGTKADATSGSSPGTSIELSNDVSYYALWVKNIDIIFNSNNCTTESKSGTITLYNGSTNASVLVPEAEMVEGWASLGASTSASSTSLGTRMGSTMTINDIDIYASLITRYYNCSKYDTKTLTMSKNDGSSVISSRSCNLVIYNGNNNGSCEVTLPESPFERVGWKFLFWGDEANSTTGYQDGATISISSDKTIYAIWEMLEHVVKLEPLDYVDGSPDKNVRVYAGDHEVEFARIEKNGETIATNLNPTISIDEVIGVEKLDVILTTGDRVEATIEIVTLE